MNRKFFVSTIVVIFAAIVMVACGKSAQPTQPTLDASKYATQDDLNALKQRVADLETQNSGLTELLKMHELPVEHPHAAQTCSITPKYLTKVDLDKNVRPVEVKWGDGHTLALSDFPISAYSDMLRDGNIVLPEYVTDVSSLEYTVWTIIVGKYVESHGEGYDVNLVDETMNNAVIFPLQVNIGWDKINVKMGPVDGVQYMFMTDGTQFANMIEWVKTCNVPEENIKIFSPEDILPSEVIKVEHLPTFRSE